MRNPAIEGLRGVGCGLFEKPPVERRLREACFREALTNVGTDFVAAGADRRPGRGKKVRGTAAELAPERVDGGTRHARGQPAPAGVRRGHRARAAIGQQERHAVGGLNRGRDGSGRSRR